MIRQDFLDILRCPMNPQAEPLQQEGNRLVCQQCHLRFKIKDGFPCLVATDAELPEGCESLSDLPCQQKQS